MCVCVCGEGGSLEGIIHLFVAGGMDPVDLSAVGWRAPISKWLYSLHVLLVVWHCPLEKST